MLVQWANTLLFFCSLATNTVVQTYNAGRPVWSCCWCLDDTNYIYAGLVNGSIMIYDLRDTNSHVQELVPQKSRYGIRIFSFLSTSLMYIKLNVASSINHTAIVVVEIVLCESVLQKFKCSTDMRSLSCLHGICVT